MPNLTNYNPDILTLPFPVSGQQYYAPQCSGFRRVARGIFSRLIAEQHH